MSRFEKAPQGRPNAYNTWLQALRSSTWWQGCQHHCFGFPRHWGLYRGNIVFLPVFIFLILGLFINPQKYDNLEQKVGSKLFERSRVDFPNILLYSPCRSWPLMSFLQGTAEADMKHGVLEISLINPWMHHRPSRINFSGVGRYSLMAKRDWSLKRT